MKVSNKALLDSVPALQRLLKEKPPIAVSWQLTKAVTKINALLTPLQEMRTQLVTEHQLKDAEGNPIKPKDADGKDVEGQALITPEGVTKITELLSQENELDVQPICIGHFGSVTIEAEVLLPIAWMFAD